MFGTMLTSPMTQLEPTTELPTAVAALLAATEQPEIARWIEFPLALLVFLLVPGDPASGAVYILDRTQGTWYAADFDDEQFGGYTLLQFEELVRECGFLDVVECPGLWRTGLAWSLAPGKPPQARLTEASSQVI